jgi:hypothetical protein
MVATEESSQHYVVTVVGSKLEEKRANRFRGITSHATSDRLSDMFNSSFLNKFISQRTTAPTTDTAE